MERIDAFPKKIRDVPEQRDDWFRWYAGVRDFRVWAHDKAKTDEGFRTELIALSEDPCFFLTVFGVIYEPRARPPLRRGWNPWILLPVQVRLLRWIDRVMAVEEGHPDYVLGRGDGVVEKDRGMGGTYTFCGYMAKRWLLDPGGFTAGCVAQKEDKVDNADDPTSMFFKIEGNLGMDPRVPETVDGVPCRLPAWLFPAGYDHNKHNQKLKLVHPTKANTILGESSTEIAGVGGRASLRVNDEGAKWSGFASTWSGQSAVTDHRLGISSADLRFGPGFYNLARAADRAQQTGEVGPSYFLMDFHDHPFHTEEVYEATRARHEAEGDLAGFEREYRHVYTAGLGTYVYRDDVDRQAIEPEPLDFDPTLPTQLWIDPGLTSPTAIHWVQKHPEDERPYWLLESYLNVNQPAGFYASIVTGVYEGGMGGYLYGMPEEEVMELARRVCRGVVTAVGDPYGRNRGGDGRKTFYGTLGEEVTRLTKGRMMLPVMVDYDQRGLEKRFDATRRLVKLLRVNDTPRTKRTLEALREHRTKDYGDRAVVNPSSEPVRFWGHDLVTAVEFGAVYELLVDQAADFVRPDPIRYTTGGRLVA